jgi:hypothetical protein
VKRFLIEQRRRCARSRIQLLLVVMFATAAAAWFGFPAARAQTATRHLTTIDGLRRFSGYFHLQNVILRGEFAEAGKRVVLRGGDSEMQVMLNDATTADGPVEVRAQLIDVGRLTSTDPRLSRYENRADPEHWPMPGEELLLSISNVAKVQPASMPTIRGLALEPWRFEGQSVTLTGQFGGRNLFGDLPAAPAKSKYDFVLRGLDGAAVWVTGLRPKGKGFDLNVDARVDTSHWVEVTGAVKQERGLVLVEARTINSASAPVSRVVIDEGPPVPKEPGEVVFSSPTDGETSVAAAAPIRVQFSRGIDPATLTGHLVISYVGGAPPSADANAIVWSYDAATHAIAGRFPKPLEPLRTVKVELSEGVKTFDGAPVKPWSITFSIAGN